jgi:hypothetical protein
MSERKDYRLNLERLNELYPDKEMLTIHDVMRLMGFTSPNSAKKYVPLTKSKQVSKATMARIMSGG